VSFGHRRDRDGEYSTLWVRVCIPTIARPRDHLPVVARHCHAKPQPSHKGRRFSSIRPLADRDLDGLGSFMTPSGYAAQRQSYLSCLQPASSTGRFRVASVPIVFARYLRADDYVVSNHRGLGHYLSVTSDFEGLIVEVMGRRSGASGDMVAVNTSGTRGSTGTEFRAA
jgi:hypothetical protein